jgi:hypothetical protein
MFYFRSEAGIIDSELVYEQGEGGSRLWKKNQATERRDILLGLASKTLHLFGFRIIGIEIHYIYGDCVSFLNKRGENHPKNVIYLTS